MQILLGSKSPRRQQLLKEMGFDYRLVFQDIDETYPKEIPVEEIAAYLAKLKADALTHELQREDDVILTSDTTVICEGQSYEKPIDAADAYRILKSLSGKTHFVMTAVCLKSLKSEVIFSEKTFVTFMELTDVEIRYYIDNFAPYDKAGAYAIQEWIGLNKIEKIEGSYFNVVGLPTHRIYSELTKLGFL